MEWCIATRLNLGSFFSGFSFFSTVRLEDPESIWLSGMLHQSDVKKRILGMPNRDNPHLDSSETKEIPSIPILFRALLPIFDARNHIRANHPSDRSWSAFHRGNALQIIHVVAHGHEQIEKHLASNLHLHLHGSASLESLAASDDQS